MYVAVCIDMCVCVPNVCACVTVLEAGQVRQISTGNTNIDKDLLFTLASHSGKVYAPTEYRVFIIYKFFFQLDLFCLNVNLFRTQIYVANLITLEIGVCFIIRTRK
jgi:hypothetical protein